jgi:DNA-binding SARP family transcriptional activator
MRYGVLGPLGLWRDGQWCAIEATKRRTLLALLLSAHGQMISADRLLDELWGEERPPTAAKVLQGYVSRLRRFVGENSLVTRKSGYRADGYQLIVQPGDVDADRFAELAEQGRLALERGEATTAIDRLEEALNLWRGPAFADVLPTPILTAELTSLRERRLAAGEYYADALMACGCHEQALAALRPITAENPLREGAHGRLMLALYRCGRQAEALATYRDLRRTLTSELGIDPSSPVQRLHERILAADPELPAPGARPVPRQLPHSSITFTGRAPEIAALADLLGRGGHGTMVIAAIVGTGGIGKSALAVHVANGVAARFPDGQLYVDLHGATTGVTPLDPRKALGWFLRSLGVGQTGTPQDSEEASARFRTTMAGRRMLVVLDNAATADQVGPLLPGGTGCAVLITSRRALTTLEGAAHLYLDALPDNEAIELLERLVGSDRIAGERDAAVALVRLCGGLPLALRITGARLAARPRLPLCAFAAHLADEQTRLDALQIGDLAVRASFLVSYEALRSCDELAARAFRLFGVLGGSDAGVPVVAAGLAEPAGVAEAALERLVDARLVQPPAPGRYGLHDLLRLFARDQARNEDTDAERRAALERVVRYYLSTAQRAMLILQPLLRGPCHRGGARATGPHSRGEARAWLETERVNLVAAVVQTDEEPEPLLSLGMSLCQVMHEFLDSRASYHDIRATQRVAVGAARRLGDRDGESRSLERLAAALIRLREYDEASECLAAAAQIFRSLGDLDAERRNLADLARARADAERRLPTPPAIGNEVAGQPRL